jgi:hypothetical protein
MWIGAETVAIGSPQRALGVGPRPADEIGNTRSPWRYDAIDRPHASTGTIAIPGNLALRLLAWPP